MFICFDGIDGSGKTTQVRLFCEWLASLRFAFQLVRDPGTTPLGERLRALLLQAKRTEDPVETAEVAIGAKAETLLYMAARAQLVEEAALPARSRGDIVVADRFLLANLAYQGHGRGADLETMRQIGAWVVGDGWPDVTFLLDIPADRALSRIDRKHDRIEAEGPEFLERVRQGFLDEARRYPGRVEIIDADDSPEEMQTRIREIAKELLGV
ncbi:MAG TPA: dTMP kinase [Pirellulaceae bacterium]|jgi:dTMP kinase|nr:dTMP kinase [Pirellulaceae bacterium]